MQTCVRAAVESLERRVLMDAGASADATAGAEWTGSVDWEKKHVLYTFHEIGKTTKYYELRNFSFDFTFGFSQDYRSMYLSGTLQTGHNDDQDVEAFGKAKVSRKGRFSANLRDPSIKVSLKGQFDATRTAIVSATAKLSGRYIGSKFKGGGRFYPGAPIEPEPPPPPAAIQPGRRSVGGELLAGWRQFVEVEATTSEPTRITASVYPDSGDIPELPGLLIGTVADDGTFGNSIAHGSAYIDFVSTAGTRYMIMITVGERATYVLETGTMLTTGGGYLHTSRGG